MTDAERITRLEETLTFLQRHVTEQDREILVLADTIAKLRAELGTLNTRLDSAGRGQGDDAAPADERPPHY